MELHPKYFGELGAAYIAKQWSSTDDQRIDRLTQDAYARGYLKPADLTIGSKMMAAEWHSPGDNVGIFDTKLTWYEQREMRLEWVK